MGLQDISIDELSERDLSQLISDGVQEGARVEYKRDLYGASDGDKKEFLKDLTSFANTLGGHLIIGVDAPSGVAASLQAIVGDADSEILRLESLARDAIEPRVNGIQMKAVPVVGGYALVVRIPRSWNPPHKVTFKGTSRFYGRSSAGGYELSVDELRVKFNSSATAFDRAAAFRAKRLALISADEGIVPLAKADGSVTVHIVPLGSTGEPIVDLEKAEDASQLLAPMASSGHSHEYNFDGFATIRSGEQAFGYTQVFRDGTVEATKVRIVASNEGVRRIPALDFGRHIIVSVPRYLAALEQLAVNPPFLVMITLSGVRGAYLGYSQQQLYDRPAQIRQDVLELPAVLIGEYSTEQSYKRALRPAFDALWNAGGLPRSTYFDANDDWQPHG